jgi:hypothetical protein
MPTPTPARSPLFGPLPTRGIWTALALTRAQFFLILAGSVVLFVFIDGPLWLHLHSSHFTRIALSYTVIPVAVALALLRNCKLRLLTVVVGTAVLSLIKLVVTALLLVVIGMAQA